MSDIWALVDDVLAQQRAKGQAKYGEPLKLWQQRPLVSDAIQESADLLQYLVQLREQLDVLTEEHEFMRQALITIEKADYFSMPSAQKFIAQKFIRQVLETITYAP